MFTQTITDRPQARRGSGRVSWLLLAPSRFGSANLAITWVEAGPGSYSTVKILHTLETIWFATRPHLPHRPVAGTYEF